MRPAFTANRPEQAVIPDSAELLQIAPVFSNSNFYDERNGEGMDPFHVLADQRPHDVQFFFRHFKDQFVVDLQGHARFQVAFADGFVDADHRELDEVSGGTLQGSIDGGAFGESALLNVLGVDVGHGADAAEQSLDALGVARVVEGFVDEGADARVLFEVSVDELLGLSRLDPEILREPECGKAINDAEVDDLGLAAMVGGDHQWRDTEDLRRGEGMDIVAAPESFDQQRIAGVVREQAKLDLRVIGGEQDVAGLNGEGGPDLAAEFGADGNVLQVGVGGGQASSGGAGLIESGMETPGGWTEQCGKSIDVGRFELRELAELEHEARDFVIGGQALEHIDGGRDGFPFAVLHGLGQVEFVEEDVAELARRVDVEFEAAMAVDLPGLGVDFPPQARGHAGQGRGVDLHSGFFHAGKNGDQREVNGCVKLPESGLFDFVRECDGEAAGDIGGFGKISGELEIEAAQRDFGQSMRGIGRIEQVRVKARVVADAGEPYVRSIERVQGGFEVVD